MGSTRLMNIVDLVVCFPSEKWDRNSEILLFVANKRILFWHLTTMLCAVWQRIYLLPCCVIGTLECSCIIILSSIRYRHIVLSLAVDFNNAVLASHSMKDKEKINFILYCAALREVKDSLLKSVTLFHSRT